MFNLRKLKSQPPAWGLLQRHCQHNQFSWAGLIASIPEEAAKHSGASCLMKQVAVVIKLLYSHTNLGMAPNMALFTQKRANPATTVGWWGNPDQAHPKSHSTFGDLAKAQAWMTGAEHKCGSGFSHFPTSTAEQTTKLLQMQSDRKQSAAPHLQDLGFSWDMC